MSPWGLDDDDRIAYDAELELVLDERSGWWCHGGYAATLARWRVSAVTVRCCNCTPAVSA